MYFFASSGGHTESIGNVWPGSKAEPWLLGVPDPYDGAGGDPYHRWGRDMTTAAAAARLGAMVRGSLVGIRVTRRGASPRIVSAQVIGTKGRTTTTGVELQRAFGLLTTYATFTTIGTAPVRHVQLSRTGSFEAQLPSAGTHRIVYAGIAGPAVHVP
jgi:stage II sporulation protein D